MTEHAPLSMIIPHQPTREEMLDHPRFRLVEHPLAGELLAILRDSRVGPAGFGDAAAKLAGFLIWETCRSFSTVGDTVPGFSGEPVPVQRLSSQPAGILILRAGDAFANPFRSAFPDAPLYHVGIARDEETLEHRVYIDNIPHLSGTTERVLILDPMLATGGSIVTTIDMLRRGFDGEIDVLTLLSAPLGLKVVLDHDDRTRVLTAALDERLNERGYILPGLGDAGDRFFGTQ